MYPQPMTHSTTFEVQQPAPIDIDRGPCHELVLDDEHDPLRDLVGRAPAGDQVVHRGPEHGLLAGRA